VNEITEKDRWLELEGNSASVQNLPHGRRVLFFSEKDAEDLLDLRRAFGYFYGLNKHTLGRA